MSLVIDSVLLGANDAYGYFAFYPASRNELTMKAMLLVGMDNI